MSSILKTFVVLSVLGLAACGQTNATEVEQFVVVPEPVQQTITTEPSFGGKYN